MFGRSHDLSICLITFEPRAFMVDDYAIAASLSCRVS
jgi:hypothetical protein